MNNPGKDLINLAGLKDNIANLVDGFGEPVIDFFMSGPAKDLPIISTVRNLVQAGNNVAGYLFAKKILAFLTELETYSAEERQAFIDKKCADGVNMIEVGETTMMVLDKLDDVRLAKMLGIAFKMLLSGEIPSRPNFEFHVHIIKNLNGYLIRKMTDIYSNTTPHIVNDAGAPLLGNLGLIDQDFGIPRDHRGLAGFSGDEPPQIGVRYLKNKLGRQFYDRFIANESKEL
jgi:hypothetical protein